MKRIALLGMPNTGKSTLFNRISGASARVGNWPGITVDLMSAKILLGGHIVELVDLPGIYDLHGFSDDEQVVRHFIEQNEIDLVMLTLNTSQLDRQLSLALQVRNLGLPTLLILNMADEARRSGVTVDVASMSVQLGMPVAMLSAKYGEGCQEALITAAATMNRSPHPAPEQLRAHLQTDDLIEREMDAIMASSVQMPMQMNDALSAKIDRIVLHPWLGLPIFFAALYVLFQFIFTAGQPLQNGVAWILGYVRGGMLEPWLANAPPWLHGLLLDGIYNGVGTVAAFVPLIVLFFLVMTMVEDSGYLSRAAFLTDALMAKMGLDGRGFVMLLMGFGCNVPALMGTRVMRSRPLRLLTMLVIPFSLCSARLQVFVFMIAALFTPNQAPVILLALYGLSEKLKPS